ncbi:MAG: YhcH/YjgK/YiaL family protein [Spirochaetes bacterium]|nr:YhcH/YjgK/YiaL family protein [Spirochaetota bacterium]
MITSLIDSRKRYYSMGGKIQTALEYLAGTDFELTPTGRYQIDGDDIFALVQRYEPKEETDTRLEGHQSYIDIQYIVSGNELIGYADKLKSGSTSVQAYNPDKDIEFFEGECSWIKMGKGMFCILYPEDLHRPGVKSDNPSAVTKVVIKIRV